MITHGSRLGEVVHMTASKSHKIEKMSMTQEGNNSNRRLLLLAQRLSSMEKLRLPLFLDYLKKRRRPREEDNAVHHFQPQDYDEVIHHWKRRPFLKVKFSCFAGEPVGFEYKLQESRRKISTARAGDEEELVLSDMVSSKQASVMFSISSDANLKRRDSISYLDGFFVSKVFAVRGGDKANLSEWVDEMDEWVEDTFDQFIEHDKLFVHYPQRPSVDGKTMYVVLFVQLHQSPR